MKPEEIRRAISDIAEHFAAHPQDARSEDKPAKAILESGLRIRVEGPGAWVITTDMPPALGGEGSAPSPGWLRRAAQAACEATMIAIRAAQEGILLDSLEVKVGSDSDDRGMLALSDAATAGPVESWARVTISARDVQPDKLQEIVKWAEQHSPVTDALCRAIPHKLHIEVA